MIKPVTNILKFICLSLFAVMLMAPSSAFAVLTTNTASGDVAGDAAALTAGTFDIDIITLAINKTAFLTADGTALTDGGQVARGTLVDFMLYIDNTTAADMADVSMTDLLPAGFAYVSSSMRIGTQPTGTGAPALYAFIKGAGGTAQGDGIVAGEFANVTGGNTINVGNNAGNDQLDVTTGQVWGIVFTVQLQ